VADWGGEGEETWRIGKMRCGSRRRFYKGGGGNKGKGGRRGTRKDREQGKRALLAVTPAITCAEDACRA